MKQTYPQDMCKLLGVHMSKSTKGVHIRMSEMCIPPNKVFKPFRLAKSCYAKENSRLHMLHIPAHVHTCANCACTCCTRPEGGYLSPLSVQLRTEPARKRTSPRGWA